LCQINIKFNQINISKRIYQNINKNNYLELYHKTLLELKEAIVITIMIMINKKLNKFKRILVQILKKINNNNKKK
jgi:hypothetical protein